MMRNIAVASLCAFLAIANAEITVSGITVIPPGLAGASSGPSSIAIGTGLLYDDEPIWGDVRDARFADVPAWMKGFTTSLPSHRVAGGTIVDYHCAAEVNTGIPSCDAYALIYKCNGCDFEEGGFSQYMVGQGFTPFRCTPKFKAVAGAGAYKHRFQGFHKNVDAGNSVTLTIPGAATDVTEYIVFVMNHAGIKCEDFGDETTCVANGQCYWDEGCYLDTCVPTPQFGPDHLASKCDYCIADDLPVGHA